MAYLYLTADRVGEETGGGLVTKHERDALATLGETITISRKELEHAPNRQEPWGWDKAAYYLFGNRIRLAHLYSGTFSDCVGKLKGFGAKVAYTIAAHDKLESRNEHEKWGIDFARLYPHLTDSNLWQRYITGYRLADVIVCPSTVAAESVRKYGGEFETKRIEIIPHGVDLPVCTKCEGTGVVDWENGEMECYTCKGECYAPIAPLPERFRVGYLGTVCAADKGVIYLLQAWAKLKWTDAVLVLGGRDSTSDTTKAMIESTGAKNVVCTGWVKNVSDFYNSISCLAVASVTEGFNCEVLECLAHGRPVICSDGAGAVDLIKTHTDIGVRFAARDVDRLYDIIKDARYNYNLQQMGKNAREAATNYTWTKIRQRYVDLWKGMMG